MLSLLRQEFYRSLRDKRLYLFIGISFFLYFFFWNLLPIRSAGWIRDYIDQFSLAPLGAGFGYLELVDEGEENISAFINFYIRLHAPKMFAELWPVILFTVYCSAILVGTRFSQRTIDLPLARGYTRRQVFLTVTIQYYVVILFILLVSYFGFLFIKFGTLWIPQLPPAYILRTVGIWLWLSLALLSLNFAAAFVMGNVFGTILANIGLSFLQNAILFVPWLIEYMGTDRTAALGRDFRSYIPLWIFTDTALWELDRVPTNGETLFLIFFPLAVIVCSILVAWYFFRRRDLR